MYQTIASFVEDYGNEVETTQKLLDALTDESLALEVAPGRRTLGGLAWHLVPSGGMLKQLGLQTDAAYGTEPPREAAAIGRAYAEAAAAVLRDVQAWPDAKLQESLPMFGMIWQNGYSLNMFVKHEVHHRGQLTVLMRQAGLKLTGVYGPTREEWQAMGMEAPV